MTGTSTAAARRPGVLRKVRRRARRLRARSRLRAANLRRTQAALRRRPAGPRVAAPPAPATLPGVQTVWGAPRTLLWVTVKRDNPTMRDLYGHWWIEAGDESWGWWPRAVPVGLRQLTRGTDGVLNGAGLIGRTGTWSRDAQHGQPAAHAFHPVLTEPVPDGEVAARLRAYAQGYDGAWRWAWTRRGAHDTCRSFQDGLLRAAGLVDGLEQLASRGSGCPFLYRPRTLLWRAQDLLDAARTRRSTGRVPPPPSPSCDSGEGVAPYDAPSAGSAPRPRAGTSPIPAKPTAGGAAGAAGGTAASASSTAQARSDRTGLPPRCGADGSTATGASVVARAGGAR